MMTRPTEAQQLAIQARLNLMLGAKDYDSLFLGFFVEDVDDDVLYAVARSEYQANQIDILYGQQLAVAVESVIGRPITQITIRAKRLAK